MSYGAAVRPADATQKSPPAVDIDDSDELACLVAVYDVVGRPSNDARSERYLIPNCMRQGGGGGGALAARLVVGAAVNAGLHSEQVEQSRDMHS